MISQLDPNDQALFAKRLLEKEERRMKQFKQAMLSPPPVPKSIPKRKIVFSTLWAVANANAAKYDDHAPIFGCLG